MELESEYKMIDIYFLILKINHRSINEHKLII